MLRAIARYAALTIAAMAAIVAVLSVTGKKTFRVETVTSASPEAVWAILSDPSSYPSWHPVFVKVDGAFEEGALVKTTVREPGKADVALTSRVVTVKPLQEIHQRLGMPVVITSDHRWILEPEGTGTRIIQDEIDVGLMVWFWDSDWVEPAYIMANKALGELASK